MKFRYLLTGACALLLLPLAVVAHLGVFGSMLDSANDLIGLGDVKTARKEISYVAPKGDGISPPPDFIGCDLAPTVNTMIIEVMEALDCE